MRNYIAILPSILFFALLNIHFLAAQEVRTLDGFGNNIEHPERGTAGDILINITTPAFTDGFSSPAGQDRPNPRIISNFLFDQNENIWDPKSLSDYNWVFGQFIDHDITLTMNSEMDNPSEMMVIVPPPDDEFFAPGNMIFMMRNRIVEGTGTELGNPRRYRNEITSFVDGSAVYGSDEIRGAWLRTFDGGKLKTSVGNLLPWNTTDGMFNSPIDPSAPFMEDATHSNQKMYIAGDVRANENPLLLSMHTLFVREHNRICDELIEDNPEWSDEQLYQEARRLNIAFLQSITFNEWLPAMGIKVPQYQGYNPELDPAIFNVFSSAAFRMGHTLLNSNILRMDNEGESSDGSIRLKDAFFNPFIVNLSGGIDPFLKGMGTQKQQMLDCKVIDDVRNFLFGIPGAGGLDLAAININRGRERGLPDYNSVRESFGLPKVRTFTEICSEPEVASALEILFETVDNIDPWVGMLAEDHMKDAIFGELVMTILERQFRVIRDGDRFYYENDNAFTEEQKQMIRNTKFHDLLMRNTDIKLMQKDVFLAMQHEDIPNGPELEPKVINAALFPNPVTPESNLKIYSRTNTIAKISMFDNLGRIVWSESVSLIEGDNFVKLDFGAEPKGAYNIHIENDLGIFTVVRAIF